jgi:hypothetical protein
VTLPPALALGDVVVSREFINPPGPADTCGWARQVVEREIGRSAERVAGYARYGHTCLSVGDPKTGQIEAAVRQFVWSQWRTHQRGVAILTRHSKEGDPATQFLYIEPAASGAWQLRVVLERLVTGRRPSGPVEIVHERLSYTAATVHRIELPHDGLSPRELIDDSVSREPTTYLLSFRPEGAADEVDF